VILPVSQASSENVSVSRLSSLVSAVRAPSGDSEQPAYPVQPLTPGEEKIVRIYEDGTDLPLDMSMKPGGY